MSKSFQEINGYTLVNHEKLDRVINGSIGAEGKLYGGLGDGASPEDVLAHYDKLGGLILKGTNKVKSGSFWDTQKGEPVKNPKPVLVFHDTDGNIAEVVEGEEIPDELKAGEILHKKRAKKSLKENEEAAPEKPAKSKKKVAEDDEDEDGEGDEE